MQTREAVDLYLKEVGKKYANDVAVKPKSQSKLLKLIRPVVELFNDKFWTDYITTIGNTIWVPDGWLDKGTTKDRLKTVAHEVIHIKQANEQTALLHGILYLFPQVLALFSLLAFLAIPFGTAWLYALLCLVFLAPIPAPFRYKKELEAYRVTTLFFTQVWSSSPSMIRWAHKNITDNLSKADYYYCWPFPSKILEDLTNTSKLKQQQYQEILDFLERHNIK